MVEKSFTVSLVWLQCLHASGFQVLEESRVSDSQENMCKEGKEAHTTGQFRRLKTISLIVSRLMECIRERERCCTL